MHKPRFFHFVFRKLEQTSNFFLWFASTFRGLWRVGRDPLFLKCHHPVTNRQQTGNKPSKNHLIVSQTGNKPSKNHLIVSQTTKYMMSVFIEKMMCVCVCVCAYVCVRLCLKFLTSFNLPGSCENRT